MSALKSVLIPIAIFGLMLPSVSGQTQEGGADNPTDGKTFEELVGDVSGTMKSEALKQLKLYNDGQISFGELWRSVVVPPKASEEVGPDWPQQSAPLSDMEVRTFDQVLTMIGQGSPVPKFMLDWAKPRVNVYVRASLTPKVNQAVEDYIRLGMIPPADASKVFEELMGKFEPNMRADVIAKLKSATPQ